MEAEDLQIVAEDLEYLRDGWSPDISDPDIRRGSASLRRLLVEGVYGNAWRAVGFAKEPTLIAVDLLNLVPSTDHGRVVCAIAWGANFRGLYMASPCIVEGESAPTSFTPPLSENGYPGERIFRLSEYLESYSGIAKGVSVLRREVIKYIANVRGGVHLSQKRKSAERELVRKLENFEKKIIVHTTDGLLVELVSIAQAVGRSQDSEKLISAIRSQI